MENLLKALDDCRMGFASTIHLFPGQIFISPDVLPEKFCNIANHDSGKKRILFDLEGMSNIVIDGHGAELMMHGRVIPFYLRNAKNIVIKNLTIDWVRPFLSQALIVGTGASFLDLQFADEYPFEIRDDKILFTGEHFGCDIIDNLLEFDTVTRAPASHARDNFGFRNGYHAELLDHQVVRLHTEYNPANRFVHGNYVVIKHEKRWSPAIVLAECEGITIENVDVYHAGGMGVVAQTCRDVTLHSVRVMPRPESDRMFSAFVDAFHFVDCTGDLRIVDCVMDNQMDDAINIHGIFLRAVTVRDNKTLRLKLMHHQQFGVQTLFPGDTAGFVDAHTLEKLGSAMVVHARLDGREYLDVEFESLPEHLPETPFLVMRAEEGVSVSIKGCTIRDNRSRGILFNTYGSCHIKDCYFRTPWEAIRICGAIDGKWYESGPSSWVCITGCTFDHCGHSGQRSVVVASALHRKNRHGQPYHGNITARNNHFMLTHPKVLSIDNVELLEFYDNTIDHDQVEPMLIKGVQVNLGKVESVKIEDHR